MNLMDTDVCIDIIRDYAPAVAWMSALSDLPGVPGFVGVELVVGCRDKRELQNVVEFLGTFPVVWPGPEAMERALTDYAPLALSHGIGGMDTLIATTATERGDTLLTFNVKHFRAVPGLTTEQPYKKTP